MLYVAPVLIVGFLCVFPVFLSASCSCVFWCIFGKDLGSNFFRGSVGTPSCVRCTLGFGIQTGLFHVGCQLLIVFCLEFCSCGFGSIVYPFLPMFWQGF